MSRPELLSSFTPSTMRPDTLEAIFVARHTLADRTVDSLAASVVDGDVEHHLVVGPRGMGKTHLLTIVVNRLRGRDLGDALAIAWLREEEWGVTNIGELYEQMLVKLADAGSAPAAVRTEARAAADGLLSVDPEVLAETAEGHLTEILAGRRLVVVVENLDQIFSSIGLDGQHQLRGYLQTHQNLVLLASSPSLSPSIATRDGLFFGFFAIHHLDELTVEEARDLILRIADLHDDEESRRLRDYLPTAEATSRLQVVARIAGGHPRLWVLMSECITTERLDEIVTLLHALLDDLTPYYQSQMASLTGQQRKVVTVLARTDGALVVKDIAARTRLAHNAAAKHIGDLVDLGFLRLAALPEGVEMNDKRKKAYELREPLLRHSLEVKESRGEPLRLIVEFLRAWYEEPQLAQWAASSQQLTARYAKAAMATVDVPRGFATETFDRALALARAGDITGALTSLEEAAGDAADDLPLMRSAILFEGGRYEECLRELDLHESVSAVATENLFRDMRAIALVALGRYDEAVSALPSPRGLIAHRCAGLAHFASGRFAEALDSFDAALALAVERAMTDGETLGALHDSRARTLAAMGRHDKAAAAASKATKAAPDAIDIRRNAVLLTMRESRRAPSSAQLDGLLGDDTTLSAWLSELLASVVDHLPDDEASRALSALFEHEVRARTDGATVAGYALGATLAPTFRSRRQEMQLSWLDHVLDHLDHLDAPDEARRWATGLREYFEHGDGASLLVLPETIRSLMSEQPQPANHDR